MADYDEDLTNLDEWIRRLKIEYDIFFNGNRKKPPDDLRMRVERTVKRLSEATDMSLAQRFRYNTLIARFCVYRDLWRRSQQEIESTTGKRGSPPPDIQAPLPIVPKQSGTNDFQIAIRDPQVEADKIKLLYEELMRMRGPHRKDSRTLSYQQFAEYIAGQTQSLQQRHHCNRVLFRISLEENSIKFTAKADCGSGG